ncbi:MAG: branched-chain amino acid ABC transporter permease [Betaproteobacteria bacterium]|nr:branched-chain amino acid ABC transporter permease [Betaproteobacteria bacterium]
MGMIYFMAASGLTLVFGLMDILNFGHGLFMALGAYVALAVLTASAGSPDLAGPGLFIWAGLAAMAAGALGGIVFERLLLRPVYGLHLSQILVTVGGLIVGEELIKMIWGSVQQPLLLPAWLQGSVLLGPVVVEIFRLLVVGVGLVVFIALSIILNRTKLGLVIRAGVEDREMIRALGYPIRRVFILVFAAGSSLAALGGMLWGLYQQMVVPQIGAQLNVLVFIVIIIGGLGSTRGALVGALALGLVSNFVGYFSPTLAAFANVALMFAVLMWRPDGLFPLKKA